jgi:exopolyphosphatase/guanosine-5'-triphosphate,3'-diphosphate pyrophosphatase
MTSLNQFAALDVGSLTVRLAVAEQTPGGGFRVLTHRREVTGLGQGLALTGELAPEGQARTLEALRTFKQVMSAHRVQCYRAVGTQALRQAANRQVFLDRVRDALGLAVEVLAP